MKGRIFRRELDVAAEIRSDTSASLPVRLAQIQLFEPDGAPRAVLLAIEVDYQAWRRIDAEAWFGFSLDSLAPDVQSYDLHSGAPVEVELGLQEPLLSPLAALGDGEAVLDGLVARLVGPAAGPATDELLADAAWRWLGVFQEQRAGATTFKRGFRSTYWGSFRAR